MWDPLVFVLPSPIHHDTVLAVARLPGSPSLHPEIHPWLIIPLFLASALRLCYSWSTTSATHGQPPPQCTVHPPTGACDPFAAQGKPRRGSCQPFAVQVRSEQPARQPAGWPTEWCRVCQAAGQHLLHTRSGLLQCSSSSSLQIKSTKYK